MVFRDIPIQKKLLRVIFLINGIVLIVTCLTFFIYEFYAFRKGITEKVSTIGEITALNSTAALAFDDHETASEILASLKKEGHITNACLYDKKGNAFARFSDTPVNNHFPAAPGNKGYFFTGSSLEGYEPVMQDNQLLGTLYLRSNLERMYERLRLYTVMVFFVIALSFLLAYLLSKILVRSISEPVLALAKTAKVISEQKDYSVRAVKNGNDELGLLTDAFNQMLQQIQAQNQSLGEFNQKLEQKVMERTLQLELVNKELEAFSYSISHDLRAPLRAIIGFTSILEETYGSSLDAEAKRIMEVIKNNTSRMSHLIDDLLSFSRMARQDIIKRAFDTNGVVKEIIQDLPVGDRKISWNIQPLPDTCGDLNTIRQVWINLLSNAVKYSRTTEEAVIEIGAINDKEQVTFFVKDNGVGFDTRYKDKLFKVFQRLHSSSEFEGTGIGLAIVEKIVSKHGGTVWVEAELNKGATFYFSLPLSNHV